MKKTEKCKPQIVVVEATSNNKNSRGNTIDGINESNENSIFSDNNLEMDFPKPKKKKKRAKFESLEVPLDTINPIEIVGLDEKKGHLFPKDYNLLLKDP